LPGAYISLPIRVKLVESRNPKGKAEIVCAYIENGKTQYEELSGLKEIVWGTDDLLELKQLVQQVLDNKGGERELYELRDGDSAWIQHMENVLRILSERL